MKYFSLFSGIGGFEYGIEKAIRNLRPTESNETQEPEELNSTTNKLCEWQCMGYSEIDKYATAIYRYHYPEHRNYGDATTINTAELPDFDLLVGGFPCQSFSIAGKRKGMSGEDIRGTLFFEIWRIARDKRPHTLLLENVPGLLSSQNGEDFQAILRSLDEIGYDVEWGCLNSKNFGVPQNRERVFIIGHIRGQGFKKIFPIEKTNTVYNETANCLDANYGKGWLDHGQRTMIMEHKKITERSGEYGNGYKTEESFCLDSGCGRDLIVGNIRRLTPTECERLQAFPDGWTEYGLIDGKKVKISDTQRYKCLGNAVTISVISAIVESLFKEE